MPDLIVEPIKMNETPAVVEPDLKVEQTTEKVSIYISIGFPNLFKTFLQ